MADHTPHSDTPMAKQHQGPPCRKASILIGLSPGMWVWGTAPPKSIEAGSASRVGLAGRLMKMLSPPWYSVAGAWDFTPARASLYQLPDAADREPTTSHPCVPTTLAAKQRGPLPDRQTKGKELGPSKRCHGRGWVAMHYSRGSTATNCNYENCPPGESWSPASHKQASWHLIHACIRYMLPPLQVMPADKAGLAQSVQHAH